VQPLAHSAAVADRRSKVWAAARNIPIAARRFDFPDPFGPISTFRGPSSRSVSSGPNGRRFRNVMRRMNTPDLSSSGFGNGCRGHGGASYSTVGARSTTSGTRCRADSATIRRAVAEWSRPKYDIADNGRHAGAGSRVRRAAGRPLREQPVDGLRQRAAAGRTRRSRSTCGGRRPRGRGLLQAAGDRRSWSRPGRCCPSSCEVPGHRAPGIPRSVSFHMRTPIAFDAPHSRATSPSAGSLEEVEPRPASVYRALRAPGLRSVWNGAASVSVSVLGV